jgi:PelA/Pel-15E family pectate lyase
MSRSIFVAAFGIVLSLAISPTAKAAEPAAFAPDDAAKALNRAVEFFRTKVAVEGGYVYAVSEDLTVRDGEIAATPKQIWIQPPGTPAIGLAYLDCYTLTKDKYYLEAARETAEALIRTQLRSGGWWGLAEFDPEQREKDHDYRIDPPGKQPKKRRSTTLDDNKTQACLRFLIRLDKLLEFKDAKLHEATRYALDHLASAQYPNGAWPQEFDGPPDPMKFPVKSASYPESWSRTFPKEKYSGRYTFNDNAMADAIDVMLEAGATYEEPHYTNAAVRCGEFIIMAQMPEPQPAWAQQYDIDMHPAWARKFEPPAVTGGESQQIMRTLMLLHRATGDEKFLKPIPTAIAYLRRSLLPKDRLARFYELQTNKPLYFTKAYELTYSDSDLPTHYGFTIDNKLDYLEAEYKKLSDPKRPKAALTYGSKVQPSKELAKEAEAVAKALDTRGAWVTEGTLEKSGSEKVRIIDSRVFMKNVVILARYAGSK